MGIDICSDKVITLNESHDLRLVTDIHKNPTNVKKNGLEISSVYNRVKKGDRRDGNPFIYALKEKKRVFNNKQRVIQVSP